MPRKDSTGKTREYDAYHICTWQLLIMTQTTALPIRMLMSGRHALWTVQARYRHRHRITLRSDTDLLQPCHLTPIYTGTAQPIFSAFTTPRGKRPSGPSHVIWLGRDVSAGLPTEKQGTACALALALEECPVDRLSCDRLENLYLQPSGERCDMSTGIFLPS